MIQLINIADVRKYRQLGKQINLDNFNGHVLTVQENELTELLGASLSYDFFNFLENGFTDVSETYTYINSNTFKILNADKTELLNNAIKLNNNSFYLVTNAVFDLTDTIITIDKNDLSSTISSVFFAIDNKYMKLLNGTVYTKNNDTIRFNGLKPFITWNLLISLLVDGSLKQSDVGNFQILGDNFQKSNQSDIKIVKSEYMQNSQREYNKIIDFLSNNNIYSLYENQNNNVNLSDFDFFIL